MIQTEKEDVNWSESRPEAQTPTQAKAEAGTRRAEDQLVQASRELAAILEKERATTVIEIKHRMRIDGGSKAERLAKMTEGAAMIACFTLNAPAQSCWEVILSLRTSKDPRGTTGHVGDKLAGRATIGVEHVHHRRRRHGGSKGGDRRPQRHARHSRARAPSGKHEESNTGRQQLK